MSHHFPFIPRASGELLPETFASEFFLTTPKASFAAIRQMRRAPKKMTLSVEGYFKLHQTVTTLKSMTEREKGASKVQFIAEINCRNERKETANGYYLP